MALEAVRTDNRFEVHIVVEYEGLYPTEFHCKDRQVENPATISLKAYVKKTT